MKSDDGAIDDASHECQTTPHSSISPQVDTSTSGEMARGYFESAQAVHPPSSIYHSPDTAFATVQEYVTFMQGKRPIQRILIANNGISAVKAIRSIRRWAYEMFADERKIQFVTMATPEDLKANAEYIRMADQIVEVPGGANSNNYANVTLIVDIAVRWEVDAVWAGWGHASENPQLPDALKMTRRNIIFIGPPAKPMKALGDKIGSTIIAQSAKVPTIAWNGDDIRVDYKAQGSIPDDIYDQANVKTVEQAIEQCQAIGFPVMIKASEGGGGKGIRKVLKVEDVADAYTAVKGEIPGSPIFIMKLAPRSRHLEVQLLADEYGEAISLSGRDCSVQRRHQKIVEEGPVTAPTAEVWEQMERAATRLAKEVRYVNAGTVEYLYMEDSPDEDLSDKDKFFFLELNPRLQVEHPVTEMITGVNLPAAQLQVAMGLPLHRIPDVRRLYAKPPFEDSPIDFDVEKQEPPLGHVIAARITAENPDAGFQPTSGAIEEINFRSTPSVWGYFSVDSSGRVHEFADSQIGHLFSWGTSRDQARKNMILALKEISIRGDIRTTVEYLVKMMESKDFVKNNITTSWLDERIARHDEVMGDRPNPVFVVIAGALCLAYETFESNKNEYLSQLSRGQFPPHELVNQETDVELIYENVKYRIKAMKSGSKAITLCCNNSFVTSDVRVLSDGGYLLMLNGKSHVVYATHEAAGFRIIFDGVTCIFSKEYDPTRIHVNAAGKLARYLVPNGSSLRRGTPFAEVEVMKMYMPLLTAEAGIVHFEKQEGAILAPGDCIARMELDDPSCVKTSRLFVERFPALKRSSSTSSLSLVGSSTDELKLALNGLEAVFDGFAVPDVEIKGMLLNLTSVWNCTALAFDEISEHLTQLATNASAEVSQTAKKLRVLVDEFSSSRQQLERDDAAESVIHKQLVATVEKMRAVVEENESIKKELTPVRDILELYQQGLFSRQVAVFQQLMSKYFDVENQFAEAKFFDDDVILKLRSNYSSNEFGDIYNVVRSHAALKKKNKVVLELLHELHRSQATLCSGTKNASFTGTLTLIAALQHKKYSHIALEARHLLMHSNTLSYQERLAKFEATVADVLQAPEDQRQALLSDIIHQTAPIFDLLISLLSNSHCKVRDTVLAIYTQRIYRSYDMQSMEVVLPESFQDTSRPGHLHATFNFCARSSGSADKDQAMPAAQSYDDLSALMNKADLADENQIPPPLPPHVKRNGVMIALPTIKEFMAQFDRILEHFPTQASVADPMHVIHAAVTSETLGEQEMLEGLTSFLKQYEKELSSRQIRRITFSVRPPVSRDSSDENQYPGIYTFRHRLHYQEDRLVRHIEAPLAYVLELTRLANYNVESVPVQNKNIYVYIGSPKVKTKAKTTQRSIFVRTICREADRLQDSNTLSSIYDAHPGPERQFVEALSALDVVVGDTPDQFSNNHVYLSVLRDAVVDPTYVEAVIRILAIRYADRLQRLRVSCVEFRINALTSADAETSIPIRLIASNPTGYVLRVESYVETGTVPRMLKAIGSDHVSKHRLDGQRVDAPYSVSDPFDQKREYAARASDTLYAYDFIEVFEHALHRLWKRHLRQHHPDQVQELMPAKVMEYRELILDEAQEGVIEVQRPLGQNTIGMIAFVFTLMTPEYPEGREIVVVANDLTFQVGSFGTAEDKLFLLATQYARKLQIPRIYLAANSGARIGLSKVVREKYKVEWVDPHDPSRGYKSIYLTPQDYKALKANEAVECERVVVNNEERYQVTDIIGVEKDLGVENLRGSGGIAGETCRAYDDIFTLTYVCGRSVGIGAYLVRLGQRTIQKETNAPIILTGYQALNKLMSKDVYTSNDQLGGIKIMHTNGITHQTVENHMDGVTAILKWLSFVPKTRHSPLPVIWNPKFSDPVQREIEFSPGNAPYDPRDLLMGKLDPATDTWLSGFLDRGSFVETLGGWAKSVVVGRGRLGGIPLGLVISEVRTAEKITPADPAAPKTQENLVQQAGQVWFPDSAHKTATAIRDFNTEELPLMVFANWRGFSGGQRDMFDEVLKFGAQIVDSLVHYQQPVFVYLPPFAELRGGAWVVIDSTINSDVMEMYADSKARGGVLEPTGLVEIKYRDAELVRTMHRLDDTLQKLDQQLEAARTSANDTAIASLTSDISRREIQLRGVYRQIAVHFADLHDTSGRMKAKAAIREVVEWKDARQYFYSRLRRRLAEFQIRRDIQAASPETSFAQSEQVLRAWMQKQVALTDDEWAKSDQSVYDWLDANGKYVQQQLLEMKQATLTKQMVCLGKQNSTAARAAILELVDTLSAEDFHFLQTKLQ